VFVTGIGSIKALKFIGMTTGAIISVILAVLINYLLSNQSLIFCGCDPEGMKRFHDNMFGPQRVPAALRTPPAAPGPPHQPVAGRMNLQ
jgi:hypothetical protein